MTEKERQASLGHSRWGVYTRIGSAVLQFAAVSMGVRSRGLRVPAHRIDPRWVLALRGQGKASGGAHGSMSSDLGLGEDFLGRIKKYKL